MASKHELAPDTSSRRAVATASTWILLIIATWHATWWLFVTVVQQALDERWHWLWWLTAKLLVWILPLWIWLTRVTSRNEAWQGSGLGGGLKLRRSLTGTLVWVGLSWLAATLLHQLPSRAAYDWATLRTAFVSPILEELLFRGLLLSFLLQRRVRLPLAIAITSVGFLLLHFPGWAHMGGLSGKLELSGRILLIGAFLGVVTGRSGSLWPAYAVHAANNAFSTGLLTSLFRC